METGNQITMNHGPPGCCAPITNKITSLRPPHVTSPPPSSTTPSRSDWSVLEAERQDERDKPRETG